MNNETRYYLPIKSLNLAHYFVKGCVCPARYIENRNEDIQDKFGNFLLFSNKKFTENTNCSLEIILNDKEKEKVKKISENFYLFEAPLPISRVKEIIFKEEKQRENTIFNITNGAAFLPDKLTKVDSDSQESKSTELEKVLKKQPYKKDWTYKIKLYNRFMGGFAIMSIARNEYQNYPLNYFNTLSFFNTIIKDKIKNQSIKVDNNYEWAFRNNNQKFEALYKAIHSKIDDDLVKQFAKDDGIHLIKRNGIYSLDEIKVESETYLVAILALYDDKEARKKLDTFISELVSNEFPEKKKEGLALIFGINKGYEAFRNSYKTENFEVDIKFKLDNQLDYYTIESIYQFVFNEKEDNSNFEYIDSWCPKLPPETKNNKEFKTYQVLDKTIIYKKRDKVKDPLPDYLESLFNPIYKKIVTEINKWVLPYLLNEEASGKGINYFKDILKPSFKEFTKSIETYIDKIRSPLLKEIKSLKRTIKDKDAKISSLEDTNKDKNTQYAKLEEENKKLKELKEGLESPHLKDGNEAKSHSKEIEGLKSRHLEDSNNKTKNYLKETESKVIPQEESKKLKENKPEKSLKPTSNKGDTTPPPSAPDLFTESEEGKKESSSYKERGQLLNNKGIGKLKEIAKKSKISKFYRYKTDNKAELVKEILKVEYSNESPR